MSEEDQQETVKVQEGDSVAAIIFDEVHSVKLMPVIQNVSTIQILTAGQFLVELASRRLNDMWSKQQMDQAKEQAKIATIRKSIRQ